MHISAGAVVYRTNSKGEPEVLLLHRRASDSYHLPKGTQNANESLEETARREIKEETGCDVILLQPLAVVDSHFFRAGQKIFKQTHYFVAELLKDGGVRDGEHDAMIWVAPAAALDILQQKGGHLKLGYEDETKVIRQFIG